jgi:hypothetical protein
VDRTGDAPRMRACATALALAAAATVMAPGRGRAQQAPTLLSAEVRLSDYGIAGWASVQWGRVSVVHAPDGSRLSVYFLRGTPYRGIAPAPAPPPPLPPAAQAPGRGAKALWAWNTAELLSDSVARNAFLAFVGAHGFTRIFLQLAPAKGEQARAGFVPFDVEATGALVGRLSALGVQVDALDGDPRYSLPRNHAGVLATVARVAEANHRLPPAERFHGVHYDVEPYLVPGYQSPRREEILDGYVELVAAVSRAAHAAGLSAGFDVPFWLGAPDEVTGERPMAMLDGMRRRVLDEVVSVANEITVMDYRTFAWGPDGGVAHALDDLHAAAAAGARVFVGVETTPVADEDLFTFRGPPDRGFPAGPGGSWIVLEPVDTTVARVWIVGNEPGRRSLAERLAGRDDLLYWPAGRPVRVPGDKLSFHALGAQRMRAATDTLARTLSASPAFEGLAYHDYVGLKALLAGGG